MSILIRPASSASEAEARDPSDTDAQSQGLLDIVHAFSATLTETPNHETLLEAILESALRLPGLDGGGLYWRDPDGSYRLVSKRGLSETFFDRVGHLAAESPQAAIIREGRLRCSCAREQAHCTDPALVQEPALAAEGISALVVLPIHVVGEPLACLNLASKRFAAVDRGTVTALDTLARQFTQALERSLAGVEASGQRQNLEGLFDAISDYLVVLDLDGRILHYNPAVATGLGYGDTLRGRPVWVVHPPEMREEVLRVVREMRDGSRQSCTLPLLKASGERVLVDTRVVLGHWSGRPAMIGISRDITAEREMQEVLREREELYSTIFNQAGDGIALLDGASLRFVEVNDAACRMLGYARAELVRLRLTDIQADPPRTDLQTRAEDARTGGQAAFEDGHRTKDGRTRDVHISLQYLRLRERGYFVAVWRDIGAEKAARMAVSNEAEWRRALIEASRDGIAIFDQDHRLLEANPRFAEMLGYAADELIGLHSWDLDANLEEARVREEFRDPLAVNATFETRHRRKDGSVYDAEVSVRGASIGGRRVFMSISRDVSDRKTH